MNIIAFPNMGINELKLDSVAFTVFGHDIAWYGIIISLAIACAVIYSYLRLKQCRIVGDHYLDLAIATVVFGVIGTRLLFVVTNLDRYKNDFWGIFRVWEGGLAIYGGIIFGVCALIIAARIKKMYVPKVLDCVGPGVMIAQAIGRWGNFMNAEAYGVANEFEFFGLKTDISAFSESNFLRMDVWNGEKAEWITAHPTFFYECVWNIIGFILINIFYKRKKYDGQVALWYLCWYGFGRMFIEGLRADSLYVGPIRVSQLIGLLFFAVCFITLIVLKFKGYKTKKPLYLKDFEEDDLPDVEEDVKNGENN